MVGTSMLGLRVRLDQVARFMEGVLGADKYRQYLEHLAKTHPDAEPMSEREFWIDYTNWQEHNPQGRCC